MEDKASIWVQENEAGERANIVLPLNHEIPGFPVSMSVIKVETTQQSQELCRFLDANLESVPPVIALLHSAISSSLGNR